MIFSGVAGSGLCILSKHPIISAFFHSWSVNGYVHRIQHGDWFGGKGVGLCKIKINDHLVNVYTAHVSFVRIGVKIRNIKIRLFCERDANIG